MGRIDLTADEIVRGVLELSRSERVAMLDSCGVGHSASHLLIAGVGGREIASQRLEAIEAGELPVIFTLSYELGARLNGIPTRESTEPDVYATAFETLIVHDYATGETRVAGDAVKGGSLLDRIREAAAAFEPLETVAQLTARSNFTREAYIQAVEAVQELIRAGETYQTNLTQQITVEATDVRPQDVFWRLRRDHPAPFAAFMTRGGSAVVSASPERFFRVDGGSAGSRITTSPIKGTRRRGATPGEDARLRHELLTSTKDRAENTMIVDLLRNDLGRVCEYGTVSVDKLCELEEHPTLFHLVSTVSGKLRTGVSLNDIIRALFPCGSITGAPKISTMRIIDELEPTPRGLSMGAIGYSVPESFGSLGSVADLSVAIRTIVFRQGLATLNVGGGITIDSDPGEEFEESLLKAKGLLSALNASL